MTLNFSPAARADVYTQFAYLLKEASTAIALRFRMQFEVAAREACLNPMIGTPLLPAHGSLAEVRSWPVPTFPAIRLYYTLSQDEVRVLRVLHGKRDISRIIPRARRTP